MPYAVFALTPTCLIPSGAQVPANIPNPSFQPYVQFAAQIMTPWFDAKDNATIAQLKTMLPAGAALLQVIDQATIGTGDSVVLPSAGTLPMRAASYSIPSLNPTTPPPPPGSNFVPTQPPAGKS